LRKAFIQTISELAAVDDRVVLLTGDLGYMAMEPFRERFPSRFFNVGVAEQNMIGLATGLAEAGFLPYAYSIATFAALRTFEFIRNGPVWHRLPVRVVGMGAGFEYGHAGPTHHALEDIGVLRTLPGLSIVVPADSAQAATAIRSTADLTGPIYYSLGKDDSLSVQNLDGRFGLARLQIVCRGGDLAIIAMGSVSVEAVAAAERLSSSGIKATVAIVSSFNPDPTQDLAELLAGFDSAISIEAQTISGALGAFVSSVIASHGISCKLHSLAVRTSPDGTSGSQQERWKKHGLDRDSIFENTLEIMRAGLPIAFRERASFATP
jgi:transketolase